MFRLPNSKRIEADNIYREALEAYRKQNINEAILQMDEAVRLLPDMSEYIATRGFFRLEDGDEERAREDFERALGHYAYETLANYGLGVLAYREKDWATAFEFFKRAWAVSPQRPEILYYMALLYHRMGDNHNAHLRMGQAQVFFDANEQSKLSKQAQKWLQQFETILKRQA